MDSALRSRKNILRRVTVILVTVGILLAMILVSIRLGAKDISMETILDAFSKYDTANSEHVIIRSLRIPRILAGAMVGAAFAVSGAIMQAMTRNPMASPSILGINAGASFGLALAMVILPAATYNQTIVASFMGAATAALLIYLVGGAMPGGASPTRMALAGSAISALFTAGSQGLAVYFNIAQELTYWKAGGVASVRWEQVQLAAPWIAGGLLMALAIAKPMTILTLGEEMASGLGERVGIIKLLGSLVVLLLTGTAVSIVGPVGFVGLVVPHIARFLIGVDYKWVIPYSLLLGALLVVVADILARIVNPPFETPLGAVTAVIGVPFFLYLALKNRGAQNG